MLPDPTAKSMTRRLVAFVLGVLLLVPTASGQDLTSLEALKARYDQLGALRASFTQVMRSDVSSDSTRIQGQVLLEDNKYRVETPAQTVVTDGSTTWIYSRADSQVVVNDADSSTSALTPQTFLAASSESYAIDSRETVTRDQALHTVLALTSDGPSTRFAEATLWIRQSDRIVTRIRATDRNGNTLDLRLHDIVVDPSLEDEPFTFTIPEEVEVIDLRPEASG